MKSGKGLGCFMAVVFVVGMIVCLAMLSSCTTTKYVPVVENKTDTTYITKHQKDSVWLHDSIRVSEKGDTVRIEKWHTKYIAREVHDTLYRAKTDSIPYPVEVIKEVPAKLNMVERGLILIGIASLMILLMFCAMKLKKFLP